MRPRRRKEVLEMKTEGLAGHKKNERNDRPSSDFFSLLLGQLIVLFRFFFRPTFLSKMKEKQLCQVDRSLPQGLKTQRSFDPRKVVFSFHLKEIFSWSGCLLRACHWDGRHQPTLLQTRPGEGNLARTNVLSFALVCKSTWMKEVCPSGGKIAFLSQHFLH